LVCFVPGLEAFMDRFAYRDKKLSVSLCVFRAPLHIIVEHRPQATVAEPCLRSEEKKPPAEIRGA
jgi:hypothetical protein